MHTASIFKRLLSARFREYLFKMNKSINNGHLLFFLIIFLATILSFSKKHNYDLQEWDESRNGVNAYEMLVTQDYINLYYNHELDTWNAKPPLFIWLIACSYKVFGFNEFALRFPAALSTILFFILCFYFIQLFEKKIVAFLTCLVLLSCKAVIGNHIGLTADFDSLLILFLTASTLFFFKYVELGKSNAIFICAVFLGLAFYTKGPASFVLVPGMGLYLVVKQQLKLLKDYKLWLALGIYIAFIFSWMIILSFFGKTSQKSYYNSGSTVETMFYHDTYQRLTNSNFDQVNSNGKTNYLFFFEVLDARLNLWNYIFYISVIIGIWSLYKFRKNALVYIKNKANTMTVFSICVVTPLIIVLTLASTKNFWYLAPTFMFIALITTKAILYLAGKWKKVKIVFVLLFLFTIARHCYYLYDLPTLMHAAFTNNEILKNKKVVVIGRLKQDLLLYLNWLKTEINFQPTTENYKAEPGELVIFNKGQPIKELPFKFDLVQDMQEYWLARVIAEKH